MSEFMDAVGLNDKWLRQAHLDRFGFEVTDLVVARERLEGVLTKEFDSLTESGVYFRLRMPDYLQRAREFFKNSGLEILRPASASDEFLYRRQSTHNSRFDQNTIGNTRRTSNRKRIHCHDAAIAKNFRRTREDKQ